MDGPSSSPNANANANANANDADIGLQAYPSPPPTPPQEQPPPPPPPTLAPRPTNRFLLLILVSYIVYIISVHITIRFTHLTTSTDVLGFIDYAIVFLICLCYISTFCHKLRRAGRRGYCWCVVMVMYLGVLFMAVMKVSLVGMDIADYYRGDKNKNKLERTTGWGDIESGRWRNGASVGGGEGSALYVRKGYAVV